MRRLACIVLLAAATMGCDEQRFVGGVPIAPARGWMFELYDFYGNGYLAALLGHTPDAIDGILVATIDTLGAATVSASFTVEPSAYDVSVRANGVMLARDRVIDGTDHHHAAMDDWKRSYDATLTATDGDVHFDSALAFDVRYPDGTSLRDTGMFPSRLNLTIASAKRGAASSIDTIAIADSLVITWTGARSSAPVMIAIAYPGEFWPALQRFVSDSGLVVIPASALSADWTGGEMTIMLMRGTYRRANSHSRSRLPVGCAMLTQEKRIVWVVGHW
jgi:hypothetical protein